MGKRYEDTEDILGRRYRGYTGKGSDKLLKGCDKKKAEKGNTFRMISGRILLRALMNQLQTCRTERLAALARYTFS